jgi:hypothetical protein
MKALGILVAILVVAAFIIPRLPHSEKLWNQEEV